MTIALTGTLVLVGAGKMGGAMLEGWLRGGATPAKIAAFDPAPPAEVRDLIERHGIRLNPQAATITDAEVIVFCGVHFMAESADVLTGDHQRVVLPDLNAGCSMADMADPDQLAQCWRDLGAMGVLDATGDGRAGVVPVTYINSAASIKAFVGERGGTVCTKSGANTSPPAISSIPQASISSMAMRAAATRASRTAGSSSPASPRAASSLPSLPGSGPAGRPATSA